MLSVEFRLGRWVARFEFTRETLDSDEGADVVLGTITHLADEEEFLAFGFTGRSE